MESVLAAISQVGFPIGVAVYTLVRLEQTIKVNSNTISDLQKTMHVMMALVTTKKDGDV